MQVAKACPVLCPWDSAWLGWSRVELARVGRPVSPRPPALLFASSFAVCLCLCLCVSVSLCLCVCLFPTPMNAIPPPRDLLVATSPTPSLLQWYLGLAAQYVAKCCSSSSCWTVGFCMPRRIYVLAKRRMSWRSARKYSDVGAMDLNFSAPSAVSASSASAATLPRVWKLAKLVWLRALCCMPLQCCQPPTQTIPDTLEVLANVRRLLDRKLRGSRRHARRSTSEVVLARTPCLSP